MMVCLLFPAVTVTQRCNLSLQIMLIMQQRPVNGRFTIVLLTLIYLVASGIPVTSSQDLL